MRIETSTLEIETSADTDVLDLSSHVEGFLRESGIDEGALLVFVPGSTAGVTTIEFESGALEDLRRALEGLAPCDAEYAHDLRWGDGNGYAHVRAALLGPSLCIPVREGRAVLGTWQQIVLCDFDNRPRRRRILLQAMGNGRA
ncbi:MAG: secondary thiamine-phosphate synthase enzyme YjbQ [Gemmatimonadota bacterium]